MWQEGMGQLTNYQKPAAVSPIPFRFLDSISYMNYSDNVHLYRTHPPEGLYVTTMFYVITFIEGFGNLLKIVKYR